MISQLAIPTCCRQSTIASLRACVERLARHRHIHDPNLVDTLLAIVGASETALDRGDDRAATNVLVAFCLALEAQIDDQIEQDPGTQIYRHAHNMIRALERRHSLEPTGDVARDHPSFATADAVVLVTDRQ